ncbi:MAG: hypothetical protein M3232_04090, partial [Thermoproteota archaeon]|nr:hypothetical protein [Thermoproteota archaeon]
QLYFLFFVFAKGNRLRNILASIAISRNNASLKLSILILPVKQRIASIKQKEKGVYYSFFMVF